ALITDNAANAFSLAAKVPPAARKLAAAFWPGPLTLVLPARAGLPSPLIGPEGGVGVRVSPHRTAIELAARLGRPLTATSANLSGQPPAITIEQARGAFAQHVAAYLDGGELGASAPSTVVAFDSAGKWHVIRAGAIAPGLLAAALGESAQ
ncbi:MAG: L-threonylcarbamoyladenylate synthase, partial [Candidatus Binataceae bacterium]